MSRERIARMFAERCADECRSVTPELKQNARTRARTEWWDAQPVAPLCRLAQGTMFVVTGRSPGDYIQSSAAIDKVADLSALSEGA